MAYMPAPANPKIFHIVHVDKLASIIADGCLWPDSVMAQRQLGTTIGNAEIKADRLQLPVDCHPGTAVGQYVPFYFCPRSVMLYVISRQNHPNVAYRDGQGPILHLRADLRRVVDWANSHQQRWAFTPINAANRAADFFNQLNDLDKLNWEAIKATSWASCRDYKMAEFLLHGAFPFDLIEGIGAHSEPIAARVVNALGKTQYKTPVKVIKEWYY